MLPRDDRRSLARSCERYSCAWSAKDRWYFADCFRILPIRSHQVQLKLGRWAATRYFAIVAP